MHSHRSMYSIFPRQLLVVVVVVFLSGAVYAQNAGADGTDMIRRASAAMGCNLVGLETSISIEGTLTASSLAVPMHVKINTQGNDRVRSELDTPKEKKTTIVIAGRGQIQHSDGRVTALADHNTSHQRPMHIPCLTNIALPSGQIDAVFIRSETIGSDIVDVLNVELKSRPKDKLGAARMKTTVWISRSTGYLMKLQYVNAAEQDANDTQLVEIEYAKYRVIDGLAVPFHQITYSGQLTLDLQIDSAQLNAQAADFNLR
jgi:outer membrane lipoprotein-sorting protein